MVASRLLGEWMSNTATTKLMLPIALAVILLIDNVEIHIRLISNTSSSQETKTLNNTSSEIEESIDNTTQDIPSIRDTLTTAGSISNKTNLQ
jgi:hypothetical protein